VDLQALRVGADLDFDLYISESGELVLYRAASLPFDVGDASRLATGGARFLFAPDDHAARVARYFERHLTDILTDDAIPTAAKARTAVFGAEGLARDILDEPNEQNLRRARRMVGSIVSFGATNALAVRQLIRATSDHGGLEVHSTNTAVYALAIASRAGITSLTRVVDLTLGAFFHDIGMTEIPLEILEKPGPLTPDDWELVWRHPEIGEGIISETRVFNDPVATAVRMHHERIDGAGYPDSAQGAEIPWEARVVSVAEVFDALTSQRPYRQPIRSYHAIQLMLDGESGVLDRDVIRSLIPTLSSDVPVTS
jgi:HD-GYP domain-containing protein (c-di-GMP phosphodiesterase class II)